MRRIRWIPITAVSLCFVMALALVAVPGYAADKFREIPADWINRLETKYSSTFTEAGPNGEAPVSPSQYELTRQQKKELRKMSLGEYYFLVATPDITEILNKHGMDDVLSGVGKDPIPYLTSKSISDQIQQVEDLRSKASAISFIVGEAYEPETTGPAFSNLSRAGVAQLHNWTTPVGLKETDNYIGLVDADGYGQGAAAAEILAYSMGYEGQVGIINFALKQWTNVTRKRGAVETFAQYPGIEVVAQEGFTAPDQTRDIAQGMLQSHPELDAIWATWMSGVATRAAEAVTNLDRADEVKVAAPDLGGKEGAKFIADPDHPIIGGAAADCIGMGRASAVLALKWLLGEKHQDVYVTARTYPVVRANLVEGYRKQTRGALGELPDEVMELLDK